MASEPRGPLLLKAGLSVFLVYHLSAVLILPMGSGIIIRELGGYVNRYANQLGFNTTWQFFSPGPSPTFYLEYSYGYPEGADLSAAEDPFEIHWLPERRKGFAWSDFYNRRLYSMRFMALDSDRTRKYLAPFLCRQNPMASTVTMRSVFERVDSVEKARVGTSDDSFQDLSSRTVLPNLTFDCNEAEASGV